MKLAPFLLLVGACSFPDLVNHNDGGPDADPTRVHGTSILSYVLLDGSVVMAPEDLSRYTMKAYVPNGDDTFTIVDIAGTKEGTFEIPVPLGTTYYLSLLYPEVANQATPPPELIVSDARDLDIGYVTVGRPDATEVRLASPVVLDLTGLSPWTPNDFLQINSFNTGTQFTDMSRATNPPADNATTATALSFDWRDGGGFQIGRLPSLIDASHGDDLNIAQYRAEALFTDKQVLWVVQREIGSFARTDLMQTDGAPLHVVGGLLSLPLDQAANVTIQLEQHRAQYPDRARSTSEGMAVVAATGPATQYQNTFGPSPWTMQVGAPTGSIRGTPDSFSVPFTFGTNPAYPASWTKLVLSVFRSVRSFRLPGATSSGGLNMPTISYVAAAPNSVTVSPLVRPPAAFSVGGVANNDEPAAIPFDGQHGVVVEWDDVLQADGYDVIVDHVYLEGTGTTGKRIARFRTTESRAVLPADLFKRGDRYVIGVYTQRGLDDAGPRRLRLPGGSSGIATSALLFSDACGNGVTETELGEQCDTMVASATCDGDCSLPVCGDAYTNPLAGETCDHGANSYGCDRDCTAVICGDGLWNQVAEDCDDGNTVAGPNGCSATCTRVGTCGDGIVQSLFESCDPPAAGGTCGPDCQVP